MTDLILHQGADLLVQHTVILCNQNHIEAQLPVLGEERHPIRPVCPPELAAVKNNLALVNHNQCLPLFTHLVMLKGVRRQTPRRQIAVIPVLRMALAPTYQILIHRKIANQAPATAKPGKNNLCGMETFSASRRTRI